MSTEYRHENKYRIDSCQEAVLKARARAVLKPDANVTENGAYRITSLYFDDYEDSCFYENENGDDLRSKFRIRFYNDDTSLLHLEEKSKVRGMTKKRACEISEDECRVLMRGLMPVITDDMSEEKKSILMSMRLRSMIPKVITVYEREPYVCDPGNVRVTFDRSIASSNDIRSFLDGVKTLRPVLRRGESLLEIKWDEMLPRYIHDQLALDSLSWCSFSKYYLCRKYNTLGGVRI